MLKTQHFPVEKTGCDHIIKDYHNIYKQGDLIKIAWAILILEFPNFSMLDFVILIIFF